ncbi:MAG: hypothetical protein Q8P11_03510 [bacterium]|nr:hypothetical protein [bacterium]
MPIQKLMQMLGAKPRLRDTHLKYKICVSGSAAGKSVESSMIEKAKEVGQQIAMHNGVLVTGATTGIPYAAAIGAKEIGGISIGFSPAATELSHVKKYQLPVDMFDLIIYTGFEYSGRNLILTRSSDAVIIIGGRIGTMNEFTIAFEDKKPIGVLEGLGGTADMLHQFVEYSGRGHGKMVYDTDPKALVERLIELIDKEKVVTISKKEYAKVKMTKQSRRRG